MSIPRNRRRLTANPPASLNPVQPPAIALQKPPVEVTQVTSTTFSGPIPDPQSLQLYGEIDPEIPRLLIEMAQGVEAHRQKFEMVNLERSHAQNDAVIEIERNRQDADDIFKKRGQNSAAIIFLFVIVAAVYTASIGHDMVASAMIGAISLITIFVVGKQKISNKPPVEPE